MRADRQRLLDAGLRGWLDATGTEVPEHLRGVDRPLQDLMVLDLAMQASDANTAASRLEARIAPREFEKAQLLGAIAKRKALLALVP